METVGRLAIRIKSRRLQSAGRSYAHYTPIKACWLLMVLGIVLSATQVRAQSGADLLIKPWPKEETLQLSSDVIGIDQAHIRQTDQDFTLQTFSLEGRVRLLPGNEISPRIGFDEKYLNIGGHDHDLPKELSDQSVAIGAGVMSYKGWIAGFTLGAGYAGNTPFADGNAYYALFDFIIGEQIDEHSQIGFVIDYNGNRSTYRDVPIPGFAYRRRFRDQLLVAIGFPYTGIEYQITSKLYCELTWSIPDDFKVLATYEFVPKWKLYGRVGREIDSFYENSLPNSEDRLFFRQRHAEVGVRYAPTDNLDFFVAAGYAWDQEFSTGFSSSTDTELAKVSDEPYWRIGLDWKF